MSGSKRCQHCTAKIWLQQGHWVSDENGVGTTVFCDPKYSSVRHKVMPTIEVSR